MDKATNRSFTNQRTETSHLVRYKLGRARFIFQSTSSMNSSSKPRFERILEVLWTAALIGPLPLVMSPIFADLRKIQSMPVYGFGILVWCVAALAFGVLVFSRWNRVTRFPDTLLSRLFFTAGIACYMSSVIASSVSIAIAGWTLLSGAWMVRHVGSHDNANRRLWSYWPALCMLLQSPVFLETEFCSAYKQWLAVVSGSFFDVLRIPFRNVNLTFEFAQSTLSIDGALVNSPSIVWMMFMSCMTVAWLRRPLVLLPAYLSITLFWTFGTHLVQLAVIAFARQRFELDFSSGWLSIALTTSTLLVAAGLFLSSDRLLRILFMPVPLEDSARGPFNPITIAWNRLLMPMAANYERGLR